MPLRHLLRILTLAACIVSAGSGGSALAQAASPVTASPQEVQLAWNQLKYIALQATDATPGGPHAITYTIVSGPAHGSFFGNSFNAQTGTLTYEPHDDYVGSDSFTFTASTANGTSAPATVSLTVAGPLPPVAHGGHFSVPFNTTHDLLLGWDPVNFSQAGPNYAPVFEFVTPPTHGSAVFNANDAIYTPATGYSGPDSFTYRLLGQFGISNTATVHITVAAAAPPVAQPGSSYVPHGTATPIALVAQDPNPGGPYALTYAVSTPPAHGSVAVEGHTATYTPASGHWGEDSFSFAATSANGTSAPAAVSLLVGQRVTLGVAGTLGDTGQTQCTDSAGSPIACAALTSHPGQDGRFGRDAQAGAPAFDYLPLSGGCVQDRVTGLTWLAETLPPATWAAASSAAASTSHCDITSGWRLPTRRELLSILNHGASHPAIDTAAFPGTHSAPYWSSDADASSAWAVDFADGNTLRADKAASHAARPVARPVNEAPTITLGADEIVLSNNERPGPRSYPGWATGISPGPAREAGQQLSATVRLLPVPGIKTLKFEVPPAIDPATGDLTFTVLHRLYPNTELGDPDHFGDGLTRYWWVSSAGRVRVEVTLQDDGGTEGGGADTTVKTFDIFISPVPYAFDVNIKHPWKAACIPVSMHAQDIDTDMMIHTVYPKRYFPYFKIKTHPSKGFLTDSVSYRARPARPIKTSISVPLGEDLTEHAGMTGNRAPVAETVSPWGFYVSTLCYIPFSSTFLGSDTFTYTVIDVDGNESEPASVSIEIFEVS